MRLARPKPIPMKLNRTSLAGLLGLALMAPLALRAATETLVLTNGTSLVGEVTSVADGKITVKDSVLGVLTIDVSAVASRHPTSTTATPAPTAATMAAVPAAKIPVHGTAGHRPPDANAPVWTRGLQLNFSRISGAAPALGVGATTNFGASLVLERATKENIASFTGSYNRSRSRPGPASVDNKTFGFQYDHIYTEELRFIARSTYMVDKPKKINHRFEQLAGAGFTLAKSAQSFLLVAPGLGYSRGSKEFVGLDEDHFGYGIFQTASHAFTPALSIEQRAFFFGAFDDSNYYVYDGYIGLKGQVTPSMAMTFGYSIVHDNKMAPGIEKTESQIMSGLQFKF